MSDVRDPATDQPLPKPGKVAIHMHVIDRLPKWRTTSEVRHAVERGLRSRLALGVSKYGRPLESHNGRDAVQDAWDESLDALVYAQQMVEEGHPDGEHVLGMARLLVMLLADVKLDRGDADVK